MRHEKAPTGNRRGFFINALHGNILNAKTQTGIQDTKRKTFFSHVKKDKKAEYIKHSALWLFILFASRATTVYSLPALSFR